MMFNKDLSSLKIYIFILNLPPQWRDILQKLTIIDKYLQKLVETMSGNNVKGICLTAQDLSYRLMKR